MESDAISDQFGASGVPKPVYRAMQLVKRMGSVAYLPATEAPGAVNLAVTATNSSCRRLGAGCFEALLVNHPTGPVDMKLNQTLPAVSVYSWLGLGD